LLLHTRWITRQQPVAADSLWPIAGPRERQLPGTSSGASP